MSLTKPSPRFRLLSWRFEVLTGMHIKGRIFYGHPVLGAVESSFVMLAVVAVLAAIRATVQYHAGAEI